MQQIGILKTTLSNGATQCNSGRNLAPVLSCYATPFRRQGKDAFPPSKPKAGARLRQASQSLAPRTPRSSLERLCVCVRSVTKYSPVRITRFTSILSDRRKGSPTHHIFFRLQADYPVPRNRRFLLCQSQKKNSIPFLVFAFTFVSRAPSIGRLAPHTHLSSCHLNSWSIGLSFSRLHVD